MVLVSFPFTDLSGNKLRPAVVLTEDDLDVTVCFITSQISWKEETDVVLTPTITNGLKKESLIRTSKIATLEKSLLKGVIGKLSDNETLELNRKLIKLLALN
ncbi:type II toxin-antitoxin system PemK/MazF family toxin [Pelobium manganitolerans]|uniref:type II toxin-antitoxin system PemK/MazF family toxin n=1 Tax=Pelobium manganitolerans TaxID=1842495 RepID=UPI001C7D352B